MTADAAAALKQSLKKLDDQRQSLDIESEAIISELTSPSEGGGPPMGIDTPLVDQDGYPRGDVDVYRARDLRHRLAVIKTDQKLLTAQVDSSLQQLAQLQNPQKTEEDAKELASRVAPKPKPKYDPVTGKWVVKSWDGSVAGIPDGEKRSFDSLSEDASNSAEATQSISRNSGFQQSKNNETMTSAAAVPAPAAPQVTSTNTPFAKIDAVAPLSPAAEAGFQAGDLIIEFGNIRHDNHQNLTALMPVVTSAADAQEEIAITLMRHNSGTNENIFEVVELALVPKPWPGRGLIGCHIVPYTNTEDM